MKIYVCECETYDYGREVVAAFSSLDEAQERMRIEYDGYMENHAGCDVEWYAGVGGQWGWYNVASTDGFYITEVELDKWE